MLRFAISSALSNLFFVKLLLRIFPFDRWRKPLCVKGRQNYPARPVSISGIDFDTSGTRLVRKSAQGLFSPWSKLSRQNCCSLDNIASSRLVAPGSLRMPVPWDANSFIRHGNCDHFCLSCNLSACVSVKCMLNYVLDDVRVHRIVCLTLIAVASSWIVCLTLIAVASSWMPE